jgi:hypothetical protein
MTIPPSFAVQSRITGRMKDKCGQSQIFRYRTNGSGPICRRPVYAGKREYGLNEGKRQNNKSPMVGPAIDPN